MALATGSLLVFIRIAAAIFTAPILGYAKVPFYFRFALIGMLTIVTVPALVGSGGLEVVSELELVSAIFSEILVGGSIGLGISILLSSAQVAGQTIGQLAGINMVDPLAGETHQAGVTGNFFNMLSLAVFALMGGPEMVVSAVLETFEKLPLGYSLDQSQLIEMIGILLGQSLSLAVRAVGPAIAALFIGTITIGFISRTIPQMNMLQVGLSSNLINFWLAIFLTLGGCVWLFVDDIHSAFEFVKSSTFHQGAALHVPK